MHSNGEDKNTDAGLATSHKDPTALAGCKRVEIFHCPSVLAFSKCSKSCDK